jgi:TonB-linked SusC/RagA family outer membrane protein
MKPLYFFIILIFILSINLQAQSQVSGTVKDAETGLPLPGVNILIVGTSEGTVADMDGKFTIDVSEDDRLKFSFVGFVDQEVAVRSQSIIDIILVPETVELDELVVTSLGLSREKMALSYSVSEVSGESFTKARENSIADALSGKIAGVNVSNIATGPAGASRVVIRGIVSMRQNNQPLYVVDGIPIDNNSPSQAGMWGGADWGDAIITINPDDIESINVLKGANASALYGSRASNGVILINTKKGKRQKGIGIEINSNFMMESVIDNTDPQTEYGHGNRGEKPETSLIGFANTDQAWGAELDGSMSYTFDDVERPYTNTFADGGNNIKKFYQTGYTWTNSIAINGGSDKQQARFSLSHLNNQGIIPNSGFERFNAGLSYNGSWGNFELESKLYYSRDKANNRPHVSDFPGNANYGTTMLPSSVDVTTLRGDPEKPGAVYEGQNNPPEANKNIGDELAVNSSNAWYTNPYWSAYQFVNNTDRHRVIGQALGRYNFTDYLYAQVRVGLDWSVTRFTMSIPYGTSYQKLGNIIEGQEYHQETNFEGIIGFRDSWNNFGINAFIGGNLMEKTFERIQINGFDFNIPFFHTPANAANQTYGYNYWAKGINSLYGSLELSWGGYLYLTATARNDWFSTLDPAHNSILYPSIGLSWVLSDAFSMPGWWNLAKIRASWAQVGGDTNPYVLDLTYRMYGLGGGHLGRVLGDIRQWSNPNRDLVPLTSTEFEVGMDVGFFNNRLGFDVSFYLQKTTDDIIPATIPVSSGFGSTWINIGEMENKGYEVLLTGSPFRGNFNWDIQINYAENHNKVIKISDEIEETRVEQSRTRTAFLGYMEGEPYGVITGYKPKIINGEKVIDPITGYPVRNDSLVIIGYGIHPYTGGITNTFTFKGWSLSFLVDVKLGADIHSGTNTVMTQRGLHKQTLAGRADSLLSSGVDLEGQVADVWIPREDLRDYWYRYAQISDYFIYDASFVRLRQLTFGYTFPARWLNKTPFSHVNISFVGRNLALLYKNTENIDPESTYNNHSVQGLEYGVVPPSRSYGFNLQIRF